MQNNRVFSKQEERALTDSGWTAWAEAITAGRVVTSRPPFVAENIIYALGLKPVPDRCYEELPFSVFMAAAAFSEKFDRYDDCAREFRNFLTRQLRSKDAPTFRSLRWRVLQRDVSTCQVCGQKAPNVALQVDHIIPISAGGKTEMGNLRTLCADCNQAKGSRI